MYTLVLKDSEKADKLKQSLPPVTYRLLLIVSQWKWIREILFKFLLYSYLTGWFSAFDDGCTEEE